MDDDEFQWDDAKAAENYAKHGVTFEAARDVFKDPFAIDGLDETKAYGEARYVTIGMAEGRDAIRIISARAAEPYEHRQYHEENR